MRARGPCEYTVLVDVSLFDFHLPAEQIAQRPAAERESSRLLVLDRASGDVAAHTSVHALPDFFRRGDLVVLGGGAAR